MNREAKARAEFNKRMAAKRMAMNAPWIMDNQIVDQNGNQISPQKELSAKEKEALERRQKEEGERRKEQEAKRRMDEIARLQKSIKEKEISITVQKKEIAKIEADMTVLKNVDLNNAKTEWHKKYIQADIDEHLAITEQRKMQLENEIQSKIDLENRLKNIEKE